ncbi:AAA family ATPase [Vibrio parahaemolyticus]
MSELIRKISRIKTHKLHNFIQEIRYPFYKKLEHNCTVTFNSPFTVLVGPNGSGKSSVLTSLYGAVRGNNLNKFWFSTKLDPIVSTEVGGSPRFIYKYIPDGMEEAVEVIKLRVRRVGSSTKREDPDYWETAKPRQADGMEKLPDHIPDEHKEHRSASRWRAVKKQVVLIDFRKELSAFDISFNFTNIRYIDSYNTIQDFLRDRTTTLSNKLQKPEKLPTSWYKQHVEKVQILSDKELEWCNKILGKNYVSAKRVEHSLFGNSGYSIIFEDIGHKYTEAVAGSGEVAVVNTVCKVLSAQNNALILLDEPEVSLHPGAQNELRNLLFETVLNKNAQVVISTHSDHFLKGLPNNFIKVFSQNPTSGLFQVINSCTPSQAFSRIGGTLEQKSRIYVEDDLAKAVVEAAIQDIDSNMISNYMVTAYPGGADTIIKNLPLHFAVTEDISNDIVILDGDKRKSIHAKDVKRYEKEIRTKKLFVKKFSSDIAKNDFRTINKTLSEQTGINGATFSLPLDDGNAPREKKEQQAIKMKLDILDKYHEKFHFLNTDTPEELLWEVAHGSLPKIYKDSIKVEDYKGKFELATKQMFGDEETNADNILNLQKIFLNHRDKSHYLWQQLMDDIKLVLSLE